MKKVFLIFLVLALILGAVGCDSDKKDTNDTATEVKESKEKASNDGTTTETTEHTASEPVVAKDKIDDEQALAAVKKYCRSNNPDLEEIEKAGEYPVYWEVTSSTEDEIVVLYRSYTAAQIRYYIDRGTGDAYVTEFVPGITDKEERTDESFNIKDYID